MGIYYTKDAVVYSLPKYYDKTDKVPNKVKEDMKQICHVIEKLRSEGKNIEQSGRDFDPYSKENH